MKQRILIGILALLVFSCSHNAENETNNKSTVIVRSSSHPFFWFYKGKNVLLLGGSNNDNLFQSPDATEQLDMLRTAGGNYVRNTMSSRDSGDVWPFGKTADGLYDLDTWNEQYWQRFNTFLKETSERDIIIQIEIWATFDFYRDSWDMNPYNPVNNINYDSRRSKLPESVPTHPIFTENNFFRSVPAQMALAPVLWYQQQFVDKLLSYSLAYPNVLYCMDNETSVTSDWGKFWANYIRKKAFEQGSVVETTEMWDPHDLSHAFHAETFDNPAIFTFVDISQNNHMSSDEHWENGLKQFRHLELMGEVRPVNNVKVYGNDSGRHKTTRDGIENFIQNVLMGCASTRFHRPTSGQGLNPAALAVIKSMRELTDQMDFFNGEPHNDLLLEREPGEAYCRAVPSEEYTVYFPEGGKVMIDLTGFDHEPSIQWLNVLKVEWSEAKRLQRNIAEISTPGAGHYVALIK